MMDDVVEKKRRSLARNEAIDARKVRKMVGREQERYLADLTNIDRGG
jgi:hypothetical protein